MSDDIEYRICKKCNRRLPDSEFEKIKQNSCGFSGSCRDCYAIRRHGRPRRPKLYRECDGIKWKTCARCKVEKIANSANFFRSQRGAFGLQSVCRPCDIKRTMESLKRRDPTFEKYKKWRAENRDKVNEIAKRARENKSEEQREAAKSWARSYLANKRRDGRFRLLQSVRSQINMVLRGKFDGGGLLRRLGYSRDDLITHIESQFGPGMTWENYGGLGKGWEIDHITPCAAFDLMDERQFQKCWALSNLRPLWAKENRSKGKKILETTCANSI